MLVIGDLVLHDMVKPRLAIVGKVEQMDHVLLLMLHPVPAVVDDLLDTESFMVFFPTMSNKDGIRLRKWHELKL